MITQSRHQKTRKRQYIFVSYYKERTAEAVLFLNTGGAKVAVYEEVQVLEISL